MATAQVHELGVVWLREHWQGAALAGQDGNQMMTDYPSERLDESSSQTFGRIQYPETAKRVVKSVGTRATEVDRCAPQCEAKDPHPGPSKRNQREPVLVCVAE